MAHDFNKPNLDSDYETVYEETRAGIATVARSDYTGADNVPTNALQWDNTNATWQREQLGLFVALGGLVPAGVWFPFGAALAPAGYLLCNGAAISRTAYSTLFNVIGTTYGGGDGITTFNVPNMQGRFPLGKAASGTGNTLGGSGGALDHTHTVPAHYHGMGTGATLNIVASGSHLHTMDHDHGSVTSSSTAPATDSQGGHYHHMVYTGGAASAINTMSDTEGIYYSFDGGGGSVYNYDLKAANLPATAARTSTDGAHTHTVASHTHSVDLPNYSGNTAANTHVHTAGNFAGVIGLLTGGVDGNASMTSGASNPPFLVSNFIIKY